MFRLLHQIDGDAAGAIRGSEQITNPDLRETCLIKSLFEESIASSQLEGAATTREVAREMLRQRRSPKDRSEQMIYNNYDAMRFVRQLGSEPLTVEAILELQRILTSDTLDDPGAAGRLRKSDEIIHVVDPFTGDGLHMAGLAELRLLDKGKVGRAFVFTAPRELHERIQQASGVVGRYGSPKPAPRLARRR